VNPGGSEENEGDWAREGEEEGNGDNDRDFRIDLKTHLTPSSRRNAFRKHVSRFPPCLGWPLPMPAMHDCMTD
jgi:hypothetical protein